MNKEYLTLLLKVAYDRGYMMRHMCTEADHNTWLAMCYEVHDVAIKYYRMRHGETSVPIWSTSEFRNFCKETLL